MIARCKISFAQFHFSSLKLFEEFPLHRVLKYLDVLNQKVIFKLYTQDDFSRNPNFKK